MEVRIRLQRFGRKHFPIYRIVAAPSKLKRDGRFLEILGTYNPKRHEVNLNNERIKFWLERGAKPTNTVSKIIQKEIKNN